MYEVKDGPLPEGVTTRSTYPFETMTAVGKWFFAEGKKPSTVRSACTGYKLRYKLPDVKFSCVKARIDGKNGTVCKRTA